MRRALTTVLAAAMALTAMIGSGWHSSAGAEGIDAWVTVSDKSPAVGCSIDVSVEVRSDGEPVTGATVSVAFFVDNNVASEDDEATGDDGVAHLSIDTSGAYAGANGWMDVNVADTYVGGLSIMPQSDGGCDGNSASFSTSGDISVSSSSSSSSSSGELTGDGSGHFISGVPVHLQEYNLSCEYASIYIATGAFGNPIPEDDMLNAVGYSDNPHWGYRGNITGWWGNTDDYGVYAEPLSDALSQFGYSGEVFYGEGDTSQLTDAIDAGMPTLVWIGEWGDTSFNAYTSDGTRFKLAAGEHVVVVYGYDDSGVYVSDPADASYKFISWDDFIPMWDVLNGMSLAVSPA